MIWSGVTGWVSFWSPKQPKALIPWPADSSADGPRCQPNPCTGRARSWGAPAGTGAGQHAALAFAVVPEPAVLVDGGRLPGGFGALPLRDDDPTGLAAQQPGGVVVLRLRGGAFPVGQLLRADLQNQRRRRPVGRAARAAQLPLGRLAASSARLRSLPGLPHRVGPLSRTRGHPVAARVRPGHLSRGSRTDGRRFAHLHLRFRRRGAGGAPPARLVGSGQPVLVASGVEPARLPRFRARWRSCSAPLPRAGPWTDGRRGRRLPGGHRPVPGQQLPDPPRARGGLSRQTSFEVLLE